MNAIRFQKFELAVLALLAAGGAGADPGGSAKNFWRNTTYYNHYVLYEKSSNRYVETVDCKARWRFTKIGGNLNELILRDAGRKLNMKISYDGMWLKFDHEPAYKFYQKGTFDKRVRFFHQNNGVWTGTVSRSSGCAWEELLAGGSSPSYRFKLYGEDANSVFLYDSSHNLRLRLNTADMWLQQSGKPVFAFFKNGHWSEN